MIYYVQLAALLAFASAQQTILGYLSNQPTLSTLYSVLTSRSFSSLGAILNGTRGSLCPEPFYIYYHPFFTRFPFFNT